MYRINSILLLTYTYWEELEGGGDVVYLFVVTNIFTLKPMFSFKPGCVKLPGFSMNDSHKHIESTVRMMYSGNDIVGIR